jgi:hypothetical protein
MRCRRCSHDLSSGADRCLRCFALNPQNVAGPLFAGLDSDPPRELRVRFDDEPAPRERPLPEKSVATPAPEQPAPAPRRFHLESFLVAWAIDFGAVAALTVLHAGLAAAVIGPERLAPGPAGSIDYWFDLFRGGGLWALWLALAATLGLAWCAFSALLTLRGRESRLPPERSAP